MILEVTEFYIFLKEKKRKTFDKVVLDIKIIKQFEFYAIDKELKYEDTIDKVSREFNCGYDNVERIIKSYRILKKKKLPPK